jgi:hypothetical protein
MTANGTAESDSSNTKAGDFIFSIHDSLVNIAPIVDTTFGGSNVYPDNEEKSNYEGITSELKLVAAVGKDKAGSMAIIQRNIQPKVIGRFEFPEARGIWTMSAKRPTEKGLEANKEKSALSGDYGVGAQYDRLMIVSKALPDGTEISDVYALTSANFEALTGTEFEPAAGSTIEAGTLGNGMRVIQVLKSEVRSYDGGKSPSLSCWILALSLLKLGHGTGGEFTIFLSFTNFIFRFTMLSGELSGNTDCPIASMKAFNTTTFMHSHYVPPSRCVILEPCLRSKQKANPRCLLDLGLAQILPMYDDDTGAEPKIVSASFADPYLLLFRDDSSIFVVLCDDNNELEEIDREDDTLLTTKWLAGCLYDDTTGAFAPVQSDNSYKVKERVMMFLLSAGGALHVSFSVVFSDKYFTKRRRFMLCLICPKPSTWWKVFASCPRFSRQTMLQDDRQLVRR